MKKCVFITIVSLFISGVQGMDGVEYLKNRGWFESVSVTQTNLSLKFISPPPIRCFVRQGNVSRAAMELVENDEAWVLNLDQEARITIGGHSRTVFIPVSFKNQQKGFKIIKTSYWFPGPTVTNAIAYLALSDIPIEVGEDDVEMIMVNGEWVKYENKQPVITPGAEKGSAMVSPSSRKGKLGKGKEESGLEEEGQSKSNTLWLYVGVSLCALCAILYFMRRKLKT